MTGATDGIGRLAAEKLAKLGHTLLLHGRSQDCLNTVQSDLLAINPAITAETYCADLSDLLATAEMTDAILAKHTKLGVLTHTMLN